MSKFEKSLMLLAGVFLLALALLSCQADRPLPLEEAAAERSLAADVWRLDINTATAEELCALPGVGPVIAERMVALRPFETPEDLLAVEGIGEATLEKIYEYLEEN